MSNTQLTHITAAPKGFRKATGIKSLIVIAVESNVQGTSYFSAEVIINSQYILKLRYQSGYTESSIWCACTESLHKIGMLDVNELFWRDFDARGILRHIVVTAVKDKECERFGRGGI